ncbi:endo-1,4-beta-xylanase [uncultured Arcticibacterium sp.]|uniref:endo-1,4-beta-xylanase n=1 Tax=uncultured Arcticibacterium sp. TaxID=2173042 RepID=UPI0030F6080C
MKTLSTLFLLVLTIASCTTENTTSTGYVFNENGEITEPSGLRLRDIVAKKKPSGNLIVGGTTAAGLLGTKTGIILDSEFGYVTPENDFKQRTIHPDNSDTWNWEEADKWVEHVAENNQIIRVHGPIGPQCSKWTLEESRTAEELETNLEDFMTALCKRYNGKKGFEYMDVVNETVCAEGTWFGKKQGYGWQNPWVKMGYDTDKNGTPLYIKKSFEIASEHAPDMKLIYNQHADYVFNTDWDLIKQTVLYLREQGSRVDGIGMQAHFNAGWELISGQKKALENLIDWAHENDLEFHITEFSVWMRDGMSKEELAKQAATYKAVMEIMVNKSNNGVVGWNTWHIEDNTGWHKDLTPSLFDTNYVAKPAYYEIQKVLDQG